LPLKIDLPVTKKIIRNPEVSLAFEGKLEIVSVNKRIEARKQQLSSSGKSINKSNSGQDSQAIVVG